MYVSVTITALLCVDYIQYLSALLCSLVVLLLYHNSVCPVSLLFVLVCTLSASVHKLDIKR